MPDASTTRRSWTSPQWPRAVVDLRVATRDWVFQLIGHPKVLEAALAVGLRTPALLRPVVQVMANLVDRPGDSLVDRTVRLLERAVPAATTQTVLPLESPVTPGSAPGGPVQSAPKIR